MRNCTKLFQFSLQWKYKSFHSPICELMRYHFTSENILHKNKKYPLFLSKSQRIHFSIFVNLPFLAHLSRRLTRWAYSIAMVRRPSVVRRRRPHFQTCICLKPAGQPRSNFMCSITGVGERLHKVLGQIRSKLWFPWQQKAPIDL